VYSAKESLGYYDLKNKECSKLLDQRKQAKLQRLQVPSQINGDNLNNIRHEANRHCRTKKWEHLKEKN
jgi:hypothetical protein